MSELISNNSGPTNEAIGLEVPKTSASDQVSSSTRPSSAQLRYLKRGLNQAGGKLPLFDETGQQISAKTIKACIVNGWATPWFNNPVKPEWLVCKLTELGRKKAK